MPKYLPHGTTFSIGSKLVGGLISIGVPDRSRGEAETTDTDSAGDREWIAGLREGGGVELTFRHDPDDVGQLQLETNFNASVAASKEECIITLPEVATAASGSRTYTFDGFVTQPPTGDLGLADDDAAEQTAVIKLSDKVTIA
ncbi:hypothetical protein LCGC14_0691730 [marine sediment metagenome]|uniref:Uncharacterized protein n=1 Tax=marine sediment metagenome TaxID=412755 RepID=A0A0F9QQ42_9ZZZZ